MDFGVFTEIKASDPDLFTRGYAGYQLARIAEGGSNNQGGVRLFWRDNPDRFVIESVVNFGTNVVSCVLVSGKGR